MPEGEPAEPPLPPPFNGNGGKLLLALAWPVLGLLGLIVVAAATIVSVAFVQAPEEAITDVAKLLTQGQLIHRMVALIILVPSIVTLALTNKVSGSAAIAALSAIAGYILGSQTGSRP